MSGYQYHALLGHHAFLDGASAPFVAVVRTWLCQLSALFFSSPRQCPEVQRSIFYLMRISRADLVLEEFTWWLVMGASLIRPHKAHCVWHHRQSTFFAFLTHSHFCSSHTIHFQILAFLTLYLLPWFDNEPKSILFARTTCH